MATSSAQGKVDPAARLLEQSTSLEGPAGWLNIPAPVVTGSGVLTASIHRAIGSLNISFLGVLEGGVYFETDRLSANFERYRNLSSWERIENNVPAFFRDAFRGHAKIKFLDQDWAELGLAAGIEENSYYIVAQRYFPGLSKVTVLAGWGTGRFARGFGGLNKTIAPGAEFIFEFDGLGLNAGLRMLLAENLVLSLAIQQIDTIGEVQNLGEVIGEHLLFGITYTEKIW